MKRTFFFISILFGFSIICLQISSAQVVFEHGSSIISIALSSDGTTLASGAADGTVKLWDMETHTNIATLEGHADGVISVAFLPNGTTLASGSVDNTVKLWDTVAHTNIATLEGHADAVISVAFSPDGTTIAAGAADGIVKLWDVENHQNTATFGGEAEGGFTPVSFSPDGTTIAYGAAGSIKLWDIENEETTATIEVIGDAVISVAFSPDGTTIAAGLDSGIIRLWDVVTRTNTITYPPISTAFTVPPTFISFSSDGTQLASTVDENVALWDIKAGTQINTLFGHTPEIAVRSVLFTPDNSLISASMDGTVRLWIASPDTDTQTPFTASTPFPFTEENLHQSVVTLTLNDLVYHPFTSQIEDALTISGIDGVTISRVSRISHTEVTIKLVFDGTDFDTDATLIISIGRDAIANYLQGIFWEPDPFKDVEVEAITDYNPGFTAFIPVTATQKSNAIVSISPSSVVSPAVGEELTFNLNIKHGENITGYQAAVFFDPTALYPTDVTEGNYLLQDRFFSADRKYRAVELTATTLDEVGNGDGTLAILTFEVIDFKPSTLRFAYVYLVDMDGKLWETDIVNGEITLPPEPDEILLGDLNRDGVVNIQDLVIVSVRFGQTGQNSADLNGDYLVDIVDLVLVANEIGADAAAPSLLLQSLETLHYCRCQIVVISSTTTESHRPNIARRYPILTTTPCSTNSQRNSTLT